MALFANYPFRAFQATVGYGVSILIYFFPVGVGWSLTKRLEDMKVTSCGDLQKVSLDALQREFGPKTGQSLYRYCRGQDDRPIRSDHQRKSVSAEVNYGIRFTTVCNHSNLKYLSSVTKEGSFTFLSNQSFICVILSFLLNQEGQLSVSGERMCTILVNRLED